MTRHQLVFYRWNWDLFKLQLSLILVIHKLLGWLPKRGVIASASRHLVSE